MGDTLELGLEGSILLPQVYLSSGYLLRTSCPGMILVLGCCLLPFLLPVVVSLPNLNTFLSPPLCFRLASRQGLL